MKLKLIPGVLATLVLVTLNATAEVTINGFASIVAGMDSDESTFRNSSYDDSLQFTPDSLLALQASSDLGENLSVTTQIISRGNNGWNAEFEWAYITYELNDNNKLRVGKLRLPFYRYSDYLDVGFAYPFVRPPKAMYSLLFSTGEGISLLNTLNAGDWTIDSNLFYGAVNDSFFVTTEPTEGQLKSFVGGNFQANRDWLTVYVAYFQTEVHIPRASLEAAADGLVTAGASESAASLLRLDGDSGSFVGGGLSVDYNNFIFNAETSTVEIEDSIVLPTTQYYVNLGYRFNKVMPYLIYEETETDANTSSAEAFPAPFQPLVQSSLDGQHFQYSATSLGLRYDFHPSAALKFQYTAYSNIVDISSGFGSTDNTESLNQFLVGIDLVF